MKVHPAMVLSGFMMQSSILRLFSIHSRDNADDITSRCSGKNIEEIFRKLKDVADKMCTGKFHNRCCKTVESSSGRGENSCKPMLDSHRLTMPCQSLLVQRSANFVQRSARHGQPMAI